jgi:4-aminobutyrate aminotransferase-like enzyme
VQDHDFDGREYLDMAAGITTMVLGHTDPDVCAHHVFDALLCPACFPRFTN